jgi:flagellar protein FliL
MLGKVFPLILGLVGLGAGVGAGLVLKPDSEPNASSAEGIDAMVGARGESPTSTGPESTPEYVKLPNQFVVPVVQDGRVAAMVVLSLSLEIAPGDTDAVYQREPKLRDVFLQVLFDHANVGGFSGSFTDGSNLVVLRTSLKEAAAMVLGTDVRDVLITDIARQDS